MSCFLVARDTRVVAHLSLGLGQGGLQLQVQKSSLFARVATKLTDCKEGKKKKESG